MALWWTCIYTADVIVDLLTFTSKVIEVLAWPVASIVLAVLFRERIAHFAALLRRIKAGPLEAEFERDVQALKEIGTSPEKADAAGVVATSSKQFLHQLAELHPRSAILESWVRLEAAARALVQARTAGVSNPSHPRAARLAEVLAQLALITQGQVTLFHELWRLRNEVAHSLGLEPTLQSARAYVDLASFLQGHIEGQVR